MGINGLMDFLHKKHPDVFESVHISSFAFKKVSFDISSIIYKYIITSGREMNKWVNSLLGFMFLFRRYSVHIAPVFDGKAPAEKAEERRDRLTQRDKSDEKTFNLSLALARYKHTGEKWPCLVQTMKQIAIKRHNEEKNQKPKRLLRPSKKEEEKEETFSVDDDIAIEVEAIEEVITNRERTHVGIEEGDVKLLKEVLTHFKIPYIQAPGEAESLASFLATSGQADAVFSIDSDCVAHKVPVFINNIDVATGTCQVIRYEKLLEELEFTPEQVTLFCILCGCDYNKHTKVKGIGPAAAYRFIKKWGTFEEIKKNEKILQVEDDGVRYERCAELFSPKYPDFTKVDMVWDLDLDFETLEEFLKNNKITHNMDKIRNLWKPPSIKFEDE